MIPAVKPLLSVAQLAMNANVAQMEMNANVESSEWHSQYSENFVETFRGQRVVVPNPYYDGAVEAEIVGSYWAGEEGFMIVVEYWCDKREKYSHHAFSAWADL